MMNDTKFLALHGDAVIPTLGTPESAGYDLVSVEDVTIRPGETVTIPLGFATEMPDHIHARIESRSGMALKGNVVVTGVIDSDYRGEWKVIMINTTKDVVTIAKGTRVAQAVFRPNVRVAFQEVSDLSESARGGGGFGSTGS